MSNLYNDLTYRLARHVKILDFDEFAILANIDPRAASWIKIRRDAFGWVQRCGETPVSDLVPQLPDTERSGYTRLISHLVEKGYMEPTGSLLSTADTCVPCSSPSTLEGLADGRRAAYYSVNDSCNLACQHCYLEPSVVREKGLGNLAETKKILDGLAEYGVSTIILTGGEPLLRLDLADVASHAKKLFSRVAITTNGTLLDEGTAALLKQAGVDEVSISFEGTSPELHDKLRGKGTFVRAVQAVEHLKRAGFDRSSINLCGTITSLNIRDLQRLPSFAGSLGVHHSYSLFQPSGRGRSNVARLLVRQKEMLRWMCGVDVDCDVDSITLSTDRKGGTPTQEGGTVSKNGTALIQRLKNYCGMGCKLLAVKQDGDVVPCHLFLSTSEFLMGNLLRENLSSIC